MDESEVKKALDEVFDTYDKSRNGYLDWAEVKKLIKDRAERNGSQMTKFELRFYVNDMMAEADKDQDDRISR